MEDHNFLLVLSGSFERCETPDSIQEMEGLDKVGDEWWEIWRVGRSEEKSVITDDSNSNSKGGFLHEAESVERELGESVEQALPPPPLTWEDVAAEDEELEQEFHQQMELVYSTSPTQMLLEGAIQVNCEDEFPPEGSSSSPPEEQEAIVPPARAKKPRVKKIRAKVVSDEPPKPKRVPKPKPPPKAPKAPKRQKTERSSVEDAAAPIRKRGRPPKKRGEETVEEREGKRAREDKEESVVVDNNEPLSAERMFQLAVEVLSRTFQGLTLQDKLDIMDVVPFQGIGAGAIVPVSAGKEKYRAKVILDLESVEEWKRLQNFEPEDPKTSAKWDAERKRWEELTMHFIRVMHIVQGDRKFSRWKGSVVNSCIGVFLTQNTSDNLSSSSFINLNSVYPLRKKEQAQPRVTEKECAYEVEEVEDPVKEDDNCERSFGVRRSLFKDFEQSNKDGDGEVPITLGSSVEIKAGEIPITLGSPVEINAGSSKARLEETSSTITSISTNDSAPEGSSATSVSTNKPTPKGSSKAKAKSKDDVDLKSMSPGQRGLYESIKSRPRTVAEWERIKHLVKRPANSPRSEAFADTVDWATVAAADVDTISEVIKERGMNNVLGGRIKGFLLTLKEVHKGYDLEWLRDVDPKVAKEYLTTFYGLGPKSIDCVRLLTLEQVAFPVDVNVARICIRLGWVPIEALPQGLHFHNLDLYPIGETVQKYLWPRLCKLDQPTLYELHYQLITCGKVFCTKTNPNCLACPLKGGCHFYLSKLRETYMVEAAPSQELPKEWGGKLVMEKEVEYRPTVYNEPIIEEPEERPRVSRVESVASTVTMEMESETGDSFFEMQDIEDLFTPNLESSIPHIDLTKQHGEDRAEPAEPASSSSREIVLLRHPIVPLPKLKSEFRLRTVRIAYVLPDDHPIVAVLGPREAEEPGQYLITIQTDPETYDDFSVEGTVLIPCRTAMNGNFPLNGTYFQVNEVFADYATCLKPLRIPRNMLWNLRRCPVYFGTTVTAIFRDASIDDVRKAFWEGYVCIRCFDRSTRAPRPLSSKLHNTANRTKKTVSSSTRKRQSNSNKKQAKQ